MFSRRKSLDIMSVKKHDQQLCGERGQTECNKVDEVGGFVAIVKSLRIVDDEFGDCWTAPDNSGADQTFLQTAHTWTQAFDFALQKLNIPVDTPEKIIPYRGFSQDTGVQFASAVFLSTTKPLVSEGVLYRTSPASVRPNLVVLVKSCLLGPLTSAKYYEDKAHQSFDAGIEDGRRRHSRPAPFIPINHPAPAIELTRTAVTVCPNKPHLALGLAQPFIRIYVRHTFSVEGNRRFFEVFELEHFWKKVQSDFLESCSNWKFEKHDLRHFWE
ncbi:hypothetical protein C8R47DRAFT_1255791 [Mycena vitilis]|nr:hypothetical protein C8R47DRAFT_1255791 [Mycena vitilis]